MKLHYCKILLFALKLYILVTPSYEHNKNKKYITPHTPTTTSRVLSECDLYMSNYDNDADMKSVKENFNRQTSRRFEEYNERMQEKRQKCKEQCDKDIQQIIVKDQVQKSLAEKVEKGCLMCGCGLGGGVAPVWGLVSGLWYATWSQYVSTTVVKMATDAGVKAAIQGLGNIYDLNKVTLMDWTKMITAQNFKSPTLLAHVVQKVNIGVCQSGIDAKGAFCAFEQSMKGKGSSEFVQTISRKAAEVAANAGEAAKLAEATEAANFLQKTTILTNTIIVSLVAILVIVLVMVIIYLILRYRRKKKMNKKQQYIKLLN
ncbi:rifin [Plasmodium sp. gorilla clade G1]|nr:rifin [Plasmodium sp. gorilla clade G1]